MLLRAGLPSLGLRRGRGGRRGARGLRQRVRGQRRGARRCACAPPGAYHQPAAPASRTLRQHRMFYFFIIFDTRL